MGLVASSLRDRSIPSYLSSLGDSALVKAHRKLMAGDLSLGEDLGEIRETIQMLKNPLNGMRQFLIADRRRNLKLLKKLLKFVKARKKAKKKLAKSLIRYGKRTGKAAVNAAANDWLELRYGFRPLVMLLGDLVEEAKKKDREAFDASKIRSARSKDERSESYRNSGTAAAVGGTVKYVSNTHDYTAGYACIQYTQTNPSSTADLLGVSPRFWPETMWELTRLSFVVDWLVGIGPWLSTLRYTPEITVLGNTVGYKLKRDVLAYATNFYTGMGDQPDGHPLNGDASYTFESYTRAVNVSTPLLPVFRTGDILDLAKTIDSIALIAQRLLK
jgi:ribosomal 50S subunit-recycling heat shock protein